MKLFVLITLFPLFTFGSPETQSLSLGASEAECLSRMAKDTRSSEERITEMLMECNNAFLKGQFYLLNPNIKMKQDEKAYRIIHYSKCESMTNTVNQWLKKCMGK